ncbi:MAG: sigma-70 family RNA polymerase sigma factor [Spirochaetes bacterium]|nr:sigma-70 family RNA polymerase sigma factor [Spirochaetota bacterium]MBX3723693.1 sigma-70 family RNA polymerase sigma factor [Turneriella sp.]
MEFSEIIAETKRPVLAAIRRHLDAKYSYAIDDVAQEVYLRAYRALNKGKLKEQGKLRSYLYTIAKNESLRMNSRCHREEMKAEKFIEGERRRWSVMPAEDDTVAEMTAQVVDELRHIPEHYARVVELTLMGFSAREIVQRLDIKPGTVKSRLSRGLALLRERIIQAA